MFRKLTTLFALLLLAMTMMVSVSAQGDDGDEDAVPEDAASSFTMFGVICLDQAVVNFTGTMEDGFDLYYQVFSGAGGTGLALTGLRQVSVAGTYTFSEIVTYSEGNTVPGGSFGSFRVLIASETSTADPIVETFVDDIQDGCASPQNPVGSSSALDGTTPTGGDGAGATNTTGTTSQGTSAILSPFGGVVNPGYVPPAKEIALVGERDEFVLPRQQTPGLIFAECEDFDVTEPGIVYDTDNVVVFWSWFADSEENLIDHIDNVDYSVAYYQTLALPNPTRTEIREIDGLFWVFYYSIIGNLRPGRYYISYKVNWENPISDGFSEFGPGTANPELNSGCEFVVQRNPDNIDVNHARWPFFAP